MSLHFRSRVHIELIFRSNCYDPVEITRSICTCILAELAICTIHVQSSDRNMSNLNKI